MINVQACLAAPLAPLHAPPDHWRPSTWVGWVLPPPTPPVGATEAAPPPPRCWVLLLPLLLLRCGDVEPHPGPMRMALANVTSLRLHWHMVADGLNK